MAKEKVSMEIDEYAAVVAVGIPLVWRVANMGYAMNKRW